MFHYSKCRHVRPVPGWTTRGRFVFWLFFNLFLIPCSLQLTGTDQRQGRRDSVKGWAQCPHPSSHHPRVGQVLSPAVWWVLHSAVDRRHPLLPGLCYSGSHWGRPGRRQREKRMQICIMTHTLFTSRASGSHQHTRYTLMHTQTVNSTSTKWQ